MDEPHNTEEAQLVRGAVGAVSGATLASAANYAARPRERLPAYLRWISAAAGVALLALLVTARTLTPSPSGSGTHQQLGLPPCTAIVLWDIPCPACGMTTSWAHVMRGNLLAAGQSNLGGMLLALIALAFIPASCYFFVTGQATRDQWFSMVLLVGVVSALVLAFIQWIARAYLWPG